MQVYLLKIVREDQPSPFGQLHVEAFHSLDDAKNSLSAVDPEILVNSQWVQDPNGEWQLQDKEYSDLEIRAIIQHVDVAGTQTIWRAEVGSFEGPSKLCYSLADAKAWVEAWHAERHPGLVIPWGYSEGEWFAEQPLVYDGVEILGIYITSFEVE